MLFRSRSARGAAMVLALVFVTVIALAVSMLLSFADTGAITTSRMEEHASDVYAADGATQVAVNTLRNSSYNAGSGESCFGTSNDLVLPGFHRGGSALVTCDAVPGTGEGGALVPINSRNRPGNAILTLGTSDREEGIYLKAQSPSDPLRIRGRVWSNSTIETSNGPTEVNHQVLAKGECFSTSGGSLTSTPAPDCGRGSALDGDPRGADPNYAPPSVVPPHRLLPPCTKTSSVVTFEPGYYDDANGLSSMMSSSSPCKGSTWWFKPGLYYFDFKNVESSLLNSSGGNVWRVDSGTLVGGTPSGGAPVVSPAVPGSCVDPLTSTTAQGVHFVFGGSSQLLVDSGRIELCGTYAADRPPLTIQGLKSGSEVTVPSSGTNTLSMSGVVEPGLFTTPEGAGAPGGDRALWTDATAGAEVRSSSFRLTGYAPASPVPAGSLVSSAQLRVVRGNSASDSRDEVTLTLVPRSGGDPVVVPVPTNRLSGLQSHSFDLTTVAGGAFAKLVRERGFTGMDVVYSASTRHAGQEEVDVLELDLAYRPPAFRSQDSVIDGSPSCVAKVPYGSSGACALVRSVNTAGQFYVQGTTYAPLAVVELSLNNVSGQVFRSGVITRSLRVTVTGSSSFTDAIIQVPDESPGFGREPSVGLYLTTFLCSGADATTCKSGNPDLRARVRLVDVLGEEITPGSRGVVVESWAAVR